MTFLAGYTLRKAITIDPTYVDAVLADFPLCIRISGDAEIGAAARADGHDLRFTAADGTTLLKYERVSISIAAGEATGVFWVKIPSVDSSTPTVIYLYYGDPAASDGQDAANTWSEYTAVYHLEETSGSTLHDAKGAFNGAFTGLPKAAAGIVGIGQNCDGVDDFGTVSHNAALNMGAANGVEIEAWIKTTGQQPETFAGDGSRRGAIAGKGFIGANAGYGIYLTNERPGFQIRRSSTESLNLVSSSTVNDGSLRYVSGKAIRNSATGVRLFVDGAEDPVGSLSTIPYNGLNIGDSFPLSIGTRYQDSGSASPRVFDFKGLVDEVRVRIGDPHSDAWTKFVYRQLTESDNELAIGSEELDVAVAPAGGMAFGGADANLDPVLEHAGGTRFGADASASPVIYDVGEQVVAIVVDGADAWASPAAPAGGIAIGDASINDPPLASAGGVRFGGAPSLTDPVLDPRGGTRFGGVDGWGASGVAGGMRWSGLDLSWVEYATQEDVLNLLFGGADGKEGWTQGPYYVAETRCFAPGDREQFLFVPGSIESIVCVSGDRESRLFVAGDSEARVFVPGVAEQVAYRGK